MGTHVANDAIVNAGYMLHPGQTGHGLIAVAAVPNAVWLIFKALLHSMEQIHLPVFTLLLLGFIAVGLFRILNKFY